MQEDHESSLRESHLKKPEFQNGEADRFVTRRDLWLKDSVDDRSGVFNPYQVQFVIDGAEVQSRFQRASLVYRNEKFVRQGRQSCHDA